MIRIEALEFSYDSREFRLAVDELTIESGERVAVIGASGSGKTTLLHLIAGIVLPERGRITTNGIDVSALSEPARRDFRIANAGLVFQEFELLEYLNVLDNILLPYRINSSLRLNRDVRERAVELARSVGIGDRLSRCARQLSQGEKQRAAVCRALLPCPSLLMADEPTGNLDPANKARVLDILLEYAEASGATLLTVTHDHELVSKFPRVIDCKEFHFSSSASGSGGSELEREGP